MSTRRPVVAFQGAPGAFSELAIRHWWHDAAEPLACPTFAALVRAVHDGTADAGVLPVENRIVGPVSGARAALDDAAAPLRVVDQVEVPVRLALLARPGTTLAMVRTVRSHPVALAQCTGFLARHALVAEAAFDTAGAARDLAAEPAARHVAALAPAPAAARYGLVVLADGVQDLADNWTRFVRLERG